MTVTGLITALVVGLVIGVLGRLVVPSREHAPVWLTLAIGVVAALSGTIGISLAGTDLTAYGLREFAIQIGLAGIGVVLAVITAGRRPGSA